MVFPEMKTDPRVNYLDYTWLISGILYEGGTDKLIPELMKRNINEVYFYNVAGTMIGQKTVSGVSGSNNSGVPPGNWTPKLSPPSKPVPQNLPNLAQQYAFEQPGTSQSTGNAYERQPNSPASSTGESEIEMQDVKQQIWRAYFL